MDEIGDDRGPLEKIAFPRSRVFYLFHVVAAFVGLDYWIDSFRYETWLPFSVRVVFRPEGDTEYVALVSALAGGIAGEFGSVDSFRSGILAFPLGSVWLHALCVAVFGQAGFAVGDMLASLAYYLALAAFLRTLRLSDAVSRTIALLTTTALTVRAWTWLVGVFPLPPGLQLPFCGPRSPLPPRAEPA